jgi:hypothetical protein
MAFPFDMREKVASAVLETRPWTTGVEKLDQMVAHVNLLKRETAEAGPENRSL